MNSQVRGKLGYISDLPLYTWEKPYDLTLEPWHTPDAKRSNVILTSHEMEISDMSGQLSDFDIDTHGFQLEQFETKLSNLDLADEEDVKTKYYEECEQLLKDRFGAQEVHIFDHVFRKTGVQYELAGPGEVQRLLRPAGGVHIDQTADSAQRRVWRTFPESASRLLQGRFRILNIWRPLISPVEDHPLAVCDYRSTTPSELVPTDLITPDYEGEQYHVKHRPYHRWWFRQDMNRDEVLIIKCFDSRALEPGSPIAKFAPHVSFRPNNLPENARPRESLEVRALVFSNNER